MNTRKTFGKIEATLLDGECDFEILGDPTFDESELNELADDIRSAQCWLRDVRRRQAEETTPELPME